MEFEALVPNVPYIASVLVVGLFLWRVFVRMLAGMESRFDHRFRRIGDQFKQIDTRFGQMETRFDDRFVSLEKKVDGLAADHHGLSRELSEFRGEMRGTRWLRLSGRVR